MNKLEIMRQKSVDILLAEMIKHQPGITTQKLWETAKEWYGKTAHPGLGLEFDMALAGLRGDYRVTNKQWYPAGHVGEPRVSTGPKVNPKQTRMDW